MTTADSIANHAVNVAESSEEILDSIVADLDTATENLQSLQNGDIDADSLSDAQKDALTDVNILGKHVSADSMALPIIMNNAFTKLPGDKAAKIVAEHGKQVQGVTRPLS